MRLKARPDLHHAALPDGVYVSSGVGELALTGWGGFAPLLERCLPLLGEGTDEDRLVTALGTERSRPALRHLLGQLEQHGMLLRLDLLGTGEPDPAERAEYAELLSYLECRSADPYAAFAAIRGAHVLLTGPVEALDVGAAALRELGITHSVHPCDDASGAPYGEPRPGAPGDVTITVLDAGQVDRFAPPGDRVLPVVVGPRAVLVGPVVSDLAGLTRWRGLVDRTLGRDGPGLALPAATAVATSAAVHLLVQDLASAAGPDAYVVSGDLLEVRALDLPGRLPPVPREVWLDDASDEPDAGGAGDTPVSGEPGDAAAGSVLAAWFARLVDPWLGLARPLAEGSLPQMPVAVRRLLTADDTVVVAQGPDQQSATAVATLAVARSVTGAAAGTSQLRWLLDGALRHLGAPDRDEVWAPVATGLDRRLLAALTVGGHPPVVSEHRPTGLGWVLVRCAVPGGPTTRAWGPDVPTAAAEALSRAVALTVVSSEEGSPDDVSPEATADDRTGHGAQTDPVGTDALRTATTDEVHALAAGLRRWLGARSLRLVGRPVPPDPHLGRMPMWAGTVRLVPRSATGHAQTQVAMTGLLTSLADRTGADVVLTRGWEHDVLEAAVHRAQASGTSLLPVVVGPDSVVVGPLWRAGGLTGCPACAELRRRTVLDHVLGADLRVAATPPGPPPASLVGLAATATASRTTGRPLAEGDVVVVSSDGVSRHRVPAHPTCAWCAPTPGSAAPAGLDLRDAAVTDDDPTRVVDGTVLLRPEGIEAAMDGRYGPVRGILREESVPYAMSMAVLAGAPVMGHGRALTFDQTRSVAVLEAYERLAGFPYEAPLVLDRTYQQVRDRAVDPLRLGRYSAEQLRHPTSKVQAYHPDVPLDWAWGVDLLTDRPRLVPAEVGFYQYDHAFKRDLRASRAAPASQRRRFFLESSSGCALGSGLAEATVHALFEVAERDAFQLSWHRALPLPRIPARELADPVVDALVALVESRGLEVHFLRATQDLDLPVVWVLAVSRDGTFPASFTSAGSGADPVSAARSGLREVAQLATMRLDWDHADARRLIEDPWEVRELEDHVRWSSAPEALDRVTAVLGGPEVSLEEAFSGWPGHLRPRQGGIVATLDLVAQRFVAAGLDELVIVDQSTREHRDQGVHVVKAVVPGTVPMVFGQAHQRLLGIPRLDAALAHRPPGAPPLDPHPFP